MWSVLFACLGAMAVQEKPASAQPRSALKFEFALPLPGVEGRIDHMAYVPTAKRLYVAALEHGSICRVELEPDKPFCSFDEPGAPAGAVYLEREDGVLIPDAKLGVLWVMVQASTRSVLSDVSTKAKVPFCSGNQVVVGPDADNIRHMPGSDLVAVAFGDGGLKFLASGANFETAWTLDLGGHPESFQINAAESRIWANVPDKQSIAVIDLEAKKVARWIEVKAAKKNYPMALAEKDKRVIIGCREPARLLVFDMETDAPAGDMPLSGDVDDIFVDEERGLLYASCGEGFVDVFERKAPGAWMPKEKVATAPGARTCLFVASEKKLFVAVPHHGEQKAEVRVFSTAP